MLPVAARQLATGTILVDETDRSQSGAAADGGRTMSPATPAGIAASA
jgi:hypothetical protein